MHLVTLKCSLVVSRARAGGWYFRGCKGEEKNEGG